MPKPFIVILILTVAGCSVMPRAPDMSSPCYANEASYECQLVRYRDVSV